VIHALFTVLTSFACGSGGSLSDAEWQLLHKPLRKGRVNKLQHQEIILMLQYVNYIDCKRLFLKFISTILEIHILLACIFPFCRKPLFLLKGYIRLQAFYVYGSVHRNIFHEITNRCSYMQ